jgi:tetratricopeptide (TPR) repeat protein
MAKVVDFDVAAAHKHFSAQCFNQAWDLIEKKNRTAEDDRLMLALNQTSIYHWLQRDDCSNQSLSVGYWQASRIQTLLGNAAEAIRFADVCLSCSGELDPFYLGYAHEALARAHKLAGNNADAKRHLTRALELASKIGKKDDRELLDDDLRQIVDGTSWQSEPGLLFVG